MNLNTSAINIQTVGAILLIIGILGLILSLLYTFVWGDRGPRDRAVEDAPPRDRYGPPRY